MLKNSILVVDDTPVNLKLVRLLLSRNGFDVRTAATAEEALKVVKQFQPELVLADIQLPGMSGLEFTRRLRADPTSQNTVVVALTAFAMNGDEDKALAAGCNGYITKPIDTRTFPALIRQYLKNSPARAAESPMTYSPQADDGESQIQELRQAFITDGKQETARLISNLGTSFDDAEASVIAHRWAGSGGSIGYPEISQSARELERVLQQNGPGSQVRKRELLVQLAGLFAKSIENPSQSPELTGQPTPSLAASVSPPELVAGLSGKRFALVGFSTQDAARLAEALDRLQALSRDLGADAAPDTEIVRPFDLVIWNAPAATKTITEVNKPLLVIGARETLLRLQPIQSSAADFLFSPWSADEIVVRSYLALSRCVLPRQPKAQAANGEKRRVLVADDDSIIRTLVQTTVQNSGFECRIAADGAEALEVSRSWQPELVILDVNMPTRSGFEVLSTLRDDPLTREIRVILLTARQQETDVIRGFGLGADDYVIKPFSPMELIARLKRLLGKSV
jgi:CheY-like chemotaxis protein